MKPAVAFPFVSTAHGISMHSWTSSQHSVCGGQQSVRRQFLCTEASATGRPCNPDPCWRACCHKARRSHPRRAVTGNSSEGAIPAPFRQGTRCSSISSAGNGSGGRSSSCTGTPFAERQGRSTPGVARAHGGAPGGATARQVLSSPSTGASPAPPFVTSSWPALQPPFSYLVRRTGT